MKVRLQKYLADAGVASRRAAEALVVSGRVMVNREVIRELGSRVDPAADEVRCDDRPVRPRRKLHVAVNKPLGYVCSRQGQGPAQMLVNDLLPREWAHLYSVGRLDRDTEGLLFLTNDGEFCLRLTHPRYGVRKKYLATVEGRVEGSVLTRLQTGVVHRGERLQADRARLLSANATRSVIELELSEGKHHEVRRLFESQGFTVQALQRTQIGPIKLGELPVGKYRVLNPKEVETLQALVQPPRPESSKGDPAPARALAEERQRPPPKGEIRGRGRVAAVRRAGKRGGR